MSVLPTLPDYIFTSQCGKGTFATVYRAYRKGKEREVVAIKCVKKSSLTKSSVENIITEISILKNIRHANIVEFKDFQWDSVYIYLIMEYCSGGDLSHFIRCRRRLPEPIAQRFLQQLAKALECLRSHNIAHMDLKPQNILLSSSLHPVLKLSDFGLSQYLHSDSEASSLRGTPLYMAPEILLKQNYDARVDLWSIGIILYECLFGQTPFASQTFAEIAEKIKSSSPVQIPYGAEVSDKCRQLILGLLQKNPNQRMTFDQFFNHPFVDLEHFPTDETYSKGVSLVQEAVSCDTEGKFDKAIQLYSQALEYLVPHLYKETNSAKRQQMRKKFMEYVSRAEELKEMLKRRSLPSTTKASPEVQDINFDEILKSRPDFRKAIYLAKQADALVVKVDDECYDDASEIYKTALEIMVSTLSKEPSGPTKEALYIEVNKWMKKAEDLKLYSSIMKLEKRKKALNNFGKSVHYNTSSESLDSSCCIQ